MRFSLSHTLSASGKTVTILALPVCVVVGSDHQANYSVKQRIQSIFGLPMASTLCEFGSSFHLSSIVSQETSIPDSTPSSSAPSQENSVLSVSNEADRLEYQFSTRCEWNHALSSEGGQELSGFVTGFTSRVGSSTNGSNRGGQNVVAKGGITKQLLFINGRMIDDKKVLDVFSIDRRF